MFSFFRARKPTGPSAVSVLPTTVAGEWDAAPSPAEDDGGYSTVSLEGGATRPTLGGRASFSAPRASDGTFVGGHTSYPPKLDGAYAGSSTAYPALRTTFARLEGLLVDRAPTLLDSLSPPLLPSALSLQSLADTIYPYKLPRAVLEAYALHDGQDPFAANTDAQGLFYGLHWMTLDQVEAEYIIWRKFEQVGGSQGMQDHFSTSSTLYEGPNGRPHPYAADEETGLADGAGGVSMEGMRSFPEGWVRRKYSHPGWLPLITDRAGNYIGVDLDPPPPPHLARSASPSTSARRQTTFGQAGQVIAFGRELDEKVVLFPGDSAGGWGRFLAAFVEDLERGAFSRLGPRAAGDGSSPGRKVGSDSDSDWEQGDGLGDAGYLNGSRYGDEGEEDGDESPERVWTMRSEYRKWLSERSEDGGIIAALAERSRRQWRKAGVGLDTTFVPPSPGSSSTPQLGWSTSKRVPLSVTVPSREDIEEGPHSSVTVRPQSPNLMGVDSPAQPEDSPPPPEHPLANATPNQSASSSVALVLSPPSPKHTRFDSPSPQRVSASFARVSQEFQGPAQRSPEHLNDGRSDRSRSLGAQGKNGSPSPSKRPPPPKPCAVELPTMLDLQYANGEGTTEYDPPAIVTRRESPNPARTTTTRGSPRFGGARHVGTLLPLASPGSPSLLDTPTRFQNNSRTSLVDPEHNDSHESITIIEGLEISSPENELVEEGTQRETVDVETGRWGVTGGRGLDQGDLPYDTTVELN